MFGCSQDVCFESNKQFQKSGWLESDSIVQIFEIKNTKTSYDLVVTSCVNEELPTYNHYVEITIKNNKTGINLFKSNYSLDIFNQETGEPLGENTEMGIQRSFKVLSALKFESEGEYELIIKQMDRFNPMPGVKQISVQLLESDD